MVGLECGCHVPWHRPTSYALCPSRPVTWWQDGTMEPWWLPVYFMCISEVLFRSVFHTWKWGWCLKFPNVNKKCSFSQTVWAKLIMKPYDFFLAKQGFPAFVFLNINRAMGTCVVYETLEWPYLQLQMWSIFERNQRESWNLGLSTGYPLVMTNSSPWKDPPFLSSVNHRTFYGPSIPWIC